MVVIAEGFLQHHEEKAIIIALNQNISIKSFLRYVDDSSHARVECIENANSFFKILNDQSSHLQYTIETEDENKAVNFLDVNNKQ